MEILIKILKEQLEEYKVLLDIANKKQKALIKNDIDGLDRINKEEHELIVGITRLEKKRLEIIGEIGKKIGSNVETLTLKELEKTAPAPFQGELNAIAAEFAQVIEDLNKINQENSGLIEQALKIVNFTIDTITNSEREVVYPSKEGKNTSQVSRIFDSRA